MRANLHALGTTILVVGVVFAASNASHRKALSKPQPQVGVAKGMGTADFDPATGKYRVSIITPAGKSDFVYEPRTNVDVVVEAVIAHDPKTDTYSYEYTLQNAQTSLQRVGDFSISYEGELTDVSVPQGWWRVPSFGRKVVTWACKNCAQHGIVPGARTTGYRIRSSAGGAAAPPSRAEPKGVEASRGTQSLPGVVQCSAAGDVPAPSIPHLEWIDEGSLSLPSGDENVVRGRTVGPVNVSATLTPLERIGRIKEYVQISIEEGWVAGTEVAASYTAALDELEKGVSASSSKDLTKGISELVKRADSDLKGGKITSEAYALVKYNVQHLLPEK